MRRFFVSFVFAVAAVGSLVTSVADASNNYLTVDSSPEQVLVQPNGRILVVADDGVTTVILRFRSSGDSDNTFNGGMVRVGRKSAVSRAGIALQPDGKILVVKQKTQIDPYDIGPAGSKLVRLNPNGSVDRRFGEGGGVDLETGNIVRIQQDGKILVAESDVNCTKDSQCGGPTTVMRLLPDGSFDQGFADAGVLSYLGYGRDTLALDLDIDAAGNIYVGADSVIAKFTPGGTPFPGFGKLGIMSPDRPPSAETGGYGIMFPENGLGKLTIHGSEILSVADRVYPTRTVLAKYHLDGTPDSSFGTNGVSPDLYPAPMTDDRSFQSVDPQVSADGAVLVGSTTFNSCTDSEPYSCDGGIVLERFTSGGDPDPSWGHGGIVNMDFGKQGGSYLSADTQPDGMLVIATSVTSSSQGDNPQIGLMRFNLNGTLDKNFGSAGIRSVPETLPNCLGRNDTYVYAIVDGHPTKGSGHPDIMAGSDSADEISGLDGDDFICGYGRSDKLKGGDGNDRVSGQAGADNISGGSGDDTLYGGNGRDRIHGGDGADKILARDGLRDRVNCGSGKDTVWADRKDEVKGCEKVFRTQ